MRVPCLHKCMQFFCSNMCAHKKNSTLCMDKSCQFHYFPPSQLVSLDRIVDPMIDSWPNPFNGVILREDNGWLSNTIINFYASLQHSIIIIDILYPVI